MAWMRDIVYGLAGVLSGPLWGWRLVSTGKWRTDWRGRRGHAPITPQSRPTLLIHAVSVGEVNAVALLVSRLRERHGEKLRVVVCTTTDTGFARAKKLFEPLHEVVRYPLDFTRCVRRFLGRVRPDAVALVELEVWPTFVEECVKRKVPVAVINGRLSERSYGRYRLVRGLLRRTFASLAVAAVQDEQYAERFVGMGVEPSRVKVTGTMKWDTADMNDTVAGSDSLRAAMGMDPGKPLVVCGSTGPGEERMFAQALAGLDVQLLVAPRKPERFDEAAREMGNPVRRTQCPEGNARPVGGEKLFLLDTLGELRKAYALADVVVIGRTFVPLGGSDMIEPLALGRPVVVGPHVENFQSSVDALLAGGGLVQLGGMGELRDAVVRLLDKSTAKQLAARGRGVIRKQQGATERHVELIESLLPNLKLGT